MLIMVAENLEKAAEAEGRDFPLGLCSSLHCNTLVI